MVKLEEFKHTIRKQPFSFQLSDDITTSRRFLSVVPRVTFLSKALVRRDLSEGTDGQKLLNLLPEVFDTRSAQSQIGAIIHPSLLTSVFDWTRDLIGALRKTDPPSYEFIDKQICQINAINMIHPLSPYVAESGQPKRKWETQEEPAHSKHCFFDEYDDIFHPIIYENWYAWIATELQPVIVPEAWFISFNLKQLSSFSFSFTHIHSLPLAHLESLSVSTTGISVRTNHPYFYTLHIHPHKLNEQQRAENPYHNDTSMEKRNGTAKLCDIFEHLNACQIGGPCSRCSRVRIILTPILELLRKEIIRPALEFSGFWSSAL